VTTNQKVLREEYQKPRFSKEGEKEGTKKQRRSPSATSMSRFYEKRIRDLETGKRFELIKGALDREILLLKKREGGGFPHDLLSRLQHNL